MPLYMRRVWPIDVGREFYAESSTFVCRQRTRVDDTNKDSSHKKKALQSQEECANRTLSNIIRQLADLALKSNDIFENLEHEGNLLNGRVQTLSRRITSLNKVVDRMVQEDSESNKLVLHEKPETIDQREPWRSTFQCEAGFFTTASRPKAIKQLYNGCEKVPDLSKLQDLRDDNLNCAKMYSDPDMFFQIWKEELITEAKKAREQKKKLRRDEKTKKAEERKMAKPQRIITYKDRIKEKEIMKGNVQQEPKAITDKAVTPSGFETVKVPFLTDGSFDEDEEEFPAPPDTFVIDEDSFESLEPRSPGILSQDDLAFIPSPPMSAEERIEPFQFPQTPEPIDHPEDFHQLNSPRSEIKLPPPPPAPAPPPPPAPAPPPPAPAPPPPVQLPKLHRQATQKRMIPAEDETLDDRSDLLRQIRCGKQLKKVTVTDTKQSKGRRAAETTTNNVAELMMRYVDQRYHATHGSDSEETDDDFDEEMFEENDFES